MKLPITPCTLFILALQIPATILCSKAIAQPRDITVRVNRGLIIQQMSGTVNYDRASGTRAARVGDQLTAIGDGVTTGTQSTASLLLDSAVGVVNVLEYTKLNIQRIDVAPGDARITHLALLRGQVRLKLRKFTSPNSELQIRTPAGLSGVRGTEFGLAVQPDGKTGVATLSGAVVTSAQGVQVDVPAGFQNFTIPGETPSAAVPLRDDTTLSAEYIKLLDRGVRKVRLTGKVDPVNIVKVNGVLQSTDRNGQFQTDIFLASSFLKVNVLVTTPLGKTQAYDLALR